MICFVTNIKAKKFYSKSGKTDHTTSMNISFLPFGI